MLKAWCDWPCQLACSSAPAVSRFFWMARILSAESTIQLMASCRSCSLPYLGLLIHGHLHVICSRTPTPDSQAMATKHHISDQAPHRSQVIQLQFHYNHVTHLVFVQLVGYSRLSVSERMMRVIESKVRLMPYRDVAIRSLHGESDDGATVTSVRHWHGGDPPSVRGDPSPEWPLRPPCAEAFLLSRGLPVRWPNGCVVCVINVISFRGGSSSWWRRP